MAKVTIQDGFGGYREAIEKASERGMDNAAIVVQDRAVLSLSKLGAKPGRDRQDPDFSAFLERAEGLVDPPGGKPRLRTGRLRGAMAFERSGKGLRRVGITAGKTYPDGTLISTVARAHELGATINHPGGTPYIIVSGRDGRPRAVFLSKKSSYKAGKKARQQRGSARLKRALKGGAAIKFTKAHTIRIPKRPFLRPALVESRATWTKAYYDEIQRTMQTIRDTTGGAP